MILVSDYFKKFHDSKEITDDVRENAQVLISKVSELLSRAGINDVQITSGFRTTAHNTAVGGAKNSAHCTGQAIDLLDSDKKIGEWCTTNIQVLMELGLYLESLSTTHRNGNGAHSWVHLTTRRPRSGSIIFLP